MKIRKIFASIIIAFLCTSTAFADIEQDTEIHKVLGGLYSLVCAVDINGNANPHINQLRQYFVNVPDGWNNQVQLERVNGSLWIGVSVGKYSSARKFLRSHAQELDLREYPDNYSWLGGDYVWLKASTANLSAARGTGTDSALEFFSADGGESWWMSYPDFTNEAAREIMLRFGVKNTPELHRPSGVHESVYESVRPNDVKKPEDIHMSRKKSSFDVEIDIGKDVIFNPIPNRRN